MKSVLFRPVCREECVPVAQLRCGQRLLASFIHTYLSLANPALDGRAGYVALQTAFQILEQLLAGFGFGDGDELGFGHSLSR